MALDFFAKYHVPVSQGYGIIEVGLPIQNIAEAAGTSRSDWPAGGRL